MKNPVCIIICPAIRKLFDVFENAEKTLSDLQFIVRCAIVSRECGFQHALGASSSEIFKCAKKPVKKGQHKSLRFFSDVLLVWYRFKSAIRFRIGRYMSCSKCSSVYRKDHDHWKFP